ncbi:unnamed protein product [Somion occarium]|uniref:DUF3074 domain-containing protein n=1 Tax=Somion occarium TaxID=3059160 RepID=A0ABP1DER1_9APHY
MTNMFCLSITPAKLSDIPSEESILAAGRAVLESIRGWKEGKSYNHHTVKTFSRSKGPNDGAAWHCRVSEHTSDDATFDEFWDKLGNNKAENEKEFISEIKKVSLVKQISRTQSIWTLYYTFPPPVSPRVFTVLQTTHIEENPRRTGIIVSIPIDLSDDLELSKLEEHGVKGHYTSVERLMELESAKVEWRMATSSTPGGSIPQFITERTMAGKISEDVPHFLKWLKSHRRPTMLETPLPAPQAETYHNKDVTRDGFHEIVASGAVGSVSPSGFAMRS